MTSKTYRYRCNNCEHTVETAEFREARECPECTGGMLVNRGEVPPDDLQRLAQLIAESSAARGVDVYAVEERGTRATEWADMTDRDRSTVSRNVRRASE